MRQLVRASSVGALALASALVLTSGGAVGASAVEVTSVGDRAATLLSTVDGAAQQAAQDFWTPERMASARPMDRVVTQGAAAAASTAAPDTAAASTGTSSRSTLAAGDAPVIGRDPRRTSDVVTGAAVSNGTPWPGTADAVKRVGRLFFTQGGGNYECSASSVDSPAGNLVVTAGHCVTENGVASTNVVFVPGLSGTTKPYGSFSASRLFTTTQWKEQDQTAAAALNYDVGFAVVGGSATGRTLAQTVGSFPIAFTPALDRVTVFGYPGRSAKSDGSTLQYCTGTRFTDVASNSDATTDRATLCSMAGGSSGGPWLSGFDAATGGGTITSVVSFSYNNAPDVLYGPLFGDVVAAVYHEAAGN